jgi:hypothetical protein
LVFFRGGISYYIIEMMFDYYIGMIGIGRIGKLLTGISLSYIKAILIVFSIESIAC